MLKSICIKRRVGLFDYEKFLRQENVLITGRDTQYILCLLDFILGILHSNHLLVNNEHGIYVIFAKVNKLWK
jgi:hypothetical protein